MPFTLSEFLLAPKQMLDPKSLALGLAELADHREVAAFIVRVIQPLLAETACGDASHSQAGRLARNGDMGDDPPLSGDRLPPWITSSIVISGESGEIPIFLSSALHLHP